MFNFFTAAASSSTGIIQSNTVFIKSMKINKESFIVASMLRSPIPFFESERLKIFLLFPAFPCEIISKIPERGSNEFIIIMDSYYPENIESYIKKIKKIDITNLIFLSNTKEMHEARKKAEIPSYFVNNNCFIDENCFNVNPNIKKKYDAVYNARFSDRPNHPEWNYELKRHFLTTEVKNLALIEPYCRNRAVSNMKMKEKYCKMSNCKYCNKRVLNAEEVAVMLNESRVGLMLSHMEGACRASTEYLLCGLPVVSTPSTGGREIWYDSYNSIICEPAKEAVKDAVNFFLKNPRNPYRIRQNCLKIMQEHRNRFINEVLNDLFCKFGIKENPRKCFDKNKEKIVKCIRVRMLNTIIGKNR